MQQTKKMMLTSLCEIGLPWISAVLWDLPDVLAPLSLTQIEPLSLSHPGVTEAAAELYRQIKSD